MYFKDGWARCLELTLQGNLTVNGFAQKLWKRQPGVCEIHLHEKTGYVRIDREGASALVSPSCVQHAVMDMAESWQQHHEDRLTSVAVDEAPVPRLGSVEHAATRADEILEELDSPTPITFRRKPGRKPKVD